MTTTADSPMPRTTTVGRDSGPRAPADPYARLRIETKEGAPAGFPRERLVPLRTVLDFLSIALVVVGFAVGTATAWVAGGTVPGLATLAGSLIAVGILLGLTS
jgi:hypothetical protein